MGETIDLKAYRLRKAAEKSLGKWQKRFGDQYSPETLLMNLTDHTLLALALPGEAGSSAYYELIMGALDLGPAIKYDFLDTPLRMKIMDIHLFLWDQIRYEMMRRLEWIDTYPCRSYRLLEIILDFQRVQERCEGMMPTLSAKHAGYPEYVQMTRRDKEAYIRRLLMPAIETFQKKIDACRL